MQYRYLMTQRLQAVGKFIHHLGPANGLGNWKRKDNIDTKRWHAQKGLTGLKSIAAKAARQLIRKKSQ